MLLGALGFLLPSCLCTSLSVILLQMVMVSPGTHLVKIHESQFTTIESQFKNKSPGSLCDHTVNLKIDSKTLYCTVYWNENILLLLSSTIKEKKKFVSLNNCHKKSHRNHTKRTLFKNILRSINLSLHLTGRIPQIILRLWGFLYASGMQDAEITKSLLYQII